MNIWIIVPEHIPVPPLPRGSVEHIVPETVYRLAETIRNDRKQKASLLPEYFQRRAILREATRWPCKGELHA